MMTALNLARDNRNKTNTSRATACARFVGATTLSLTAFILSCGESRADGFRLPNQDPEAIARGNAFVATANNPSAIYYNPAGITQLEGQTVSAGLYAISTAGKFEAPNGGTAETSRAFTEVPQLYYVNTLTNYPISFGVGVYVPYGLGIDYRDPVAFRNVGQNGSLLYATVNPVIAWKINPELSIAAGPTINYSKVQFNQGVLADPDRGHLVGDAWDIGFNAGARYQPLKQLAFGVNYHSPTQMDYRGHSTLSNFAFGGNGSNPLAGSLKFPQYVVGGISYRPTEKWNLEFDLDWTDWADTKQIGLAGNLGAIGPIPSLALNYRSSFMYDFGVTREFGKGWFVSVGYIFSENSSPDADYNPIIPDSDLHLFNAGFGHHGARWGWAFSYTVAVNPSRNVAGSSYDRTGVYPNTSVDGDYRTINTALNGSVTFKF